MDETDEVAMLARKFTIMHLFWLHNDKQTFRTRLDEQFDPMEHFENQTNKVQGQLIDLLDFLPSTYADMVRDGEVSWLSKKVSKIYVTDRSWLNNHICLVL